VVVPVSLSRSAVVGSATAAAAIALLAGAVAVALATGESPHSGAMSLQGGTAWFWSKPDHELVQIDGSTAKRTARLPVDGEALSVLQAGDAALVVDPAGGRASHVDAATWTVSPAVTVDSGAASTGPLRVVASGDTVWALLKGATLLQQLDNHTLDPVGAPISLGGAAADAAVTADGTVWVTTADGALRSFRNASPMTEARVPGASDAHVVLAGDQPVVADPGHPAAFAIDPASGQPGGARCLPTTPDQKPVFGGTSSRRPWLLTMATATGTLLVTDTAAGTCQAVDVGPAGDGYGQPVERDGLVYIADTHQGVVFVVDPAQPPGPGQLKAKVTLGLADRTVTLFVHDRFVWFDEPDGTSAGVITEDLTAKRISKVDGTAQSTEAAGPTPSANPNADNGGGASANGPQPASTPSEPATPPAGTPTGPSVTAPSLQPPPNATPGITVVGPIGDRHPTSAGSGGAGGAGGSGAGGSSGSGAGGAGASGSGAGSPPGGASAPVGGGGPGANAAARARWTASANPTVGLPVTFTDSTAGSHTVQSWDFGNGTTWPNDTNTGADASSPPAVTFGQAKDFTVTLTVVLPDGSASVDRRALTIHPANRPPPSPPDAPTNLTVAPGQGQLTIGWTPGADGGGNNLAFQVTVGSTTYVTSAPPFTATGLTNGTTYQLAIVATTDAGHSDPLVGTGTPVANAPTMSVVGTYSGDPLVFTVGFNVDWGGDVGTCRVDLYSRDDVNQPYAPDATGATATTTTCPTVNGGGSAELHVLRGHHYLAEVSVTNGAGFASGDSTDIFDALPVTRTLMYTASRTGNLVFGFGEDVVIGQACDNGFSRQSYRISAVTVSPSGRAPVGTIKGWSDQNGSTKASGGPDGKDPYIVSGSATDCYIVVHFSIDNAVPATTLSVTVEIVEIGP
jgi:hypothetical protein